MQGQGSGSRRRALWIIIAVGLLAPGRAHPEGLSGTALAHTSAGAKAPRASIANNMTLEETFHIRVAFKEAAKKLARDDSCSSLFHDLNIDGLEALARSRYEPARTACPCCRGAAAYTAVGANRVLICRRFHSLQRPTRTAILIHEALHTAGLTEAPRDPRAMTSKEITEMVEEACSL